MNRRQKVILMNFMAVIVVTAIAVVVMINVKDWVNRSEAMRAMEDLGKKIKDYRETYGSVPPESYVDSVRESLRGHVRLGDLHYRALWIDFESVPDEILAYTERKSRSLLFSDGFIVLRLDGTVQWMGKKEFQTLLAQQQSPMEIQMRQQ